MYLRLTFFVLFTTLSYSASFGQIKQDTLRGIDVIAEHPKSADLKLNHFSPGQMVQQIDTVTLKEYRLQNLATLLDQQTSVFVKSYGFNGIATLNLHGASAAQSAVLWNGIPLMNAALGIADIATLPVGLMGRVSLVYGSSSALWGSGNVGGAIMLESVSPVFDTGYRHVSLSVGVGSFGHYQLGVSAATCIKNWYVGVDYSGQQATNNFGYQKQDGTSSNMQNDQLSSQDMKVTAAVKPGLHQTLEFQFWIQQYDRQIPPALFEPYSVKKQNDQSVRGLINWTLTKERVNWYAKLFSALDNISYQDASVNVNTNNHAVQYYGEAGMENDLGKWGRLTLFAPVQLLAMNQEMTGIERQQNRAALAGAYDIRLPDGRTEIALNGRDEVVNGLNVLCPGADGSYKAAKWLKLKADLQKTYRLPTLNELYYFPGGNPSLKPEQGWSGEAGYSANIQLSPKWRLHQDATYFDRAIKDWIYWLGGAIWTPYNIAKVHSRGTETVTEVHYNTGKWDWHIGVGTAYVLATTVSSYLPNDGSVGKEIPYSPRYKGSVNFGFQKGIVNVNYNHAYTGYRFITTDESEYLNPYQVGNLQIMIDPRSKHHHYELALQCDNIWNNTYQVVAYRPMPGRNWLAGIKFDML